MQVLRTQQEDHHCNPESVLGICAGGGHEVQLKVSWKPEGEARIAKHGLPMGSVFCRGTGTAIHTEERDCISREHGF